MVPKYSLFLDAIKAFDRVEYVRLFSLLLKKGLSPVIVILLLNMYTNQCANVSWCNEVSDTFKYSNGIKQGGVILPILFAVYIDKYNTVKEFWVWMSWVTYLVEHWLMPTMQFS